VHAHCPGWQEVDRSVHDQLLNWRSRKRWRLLMEHQARHFFRPRVGTELWTHLFNQCFGLGAGLWNRGGAKQVRDRRELGEIAVLVGPAHAWLSVTDPGVEKA
jgi:hypothetical protein